MPLPTASGLAFGLIFAMRHSVAIAEAIVLGLACSGLPLWGSRGGPLCRTKNATARRLTFLFTHPSIINLLRVRPAFFVHQIILSGCSEDACQ